MIKLRKLNIDVKEQTVTERRNIKIYVTDYFVEKSKIEVLIEQHKNECNIKWSDSYIDDFLNKYNAKCFTIATSNTSVCNVLLTDKELKELISD